LKKYLLLIILAYIIVQVALNWDFGDAVKGPYPTTGKATWYTASTTATGEHLDNNSLTCALRKKEYGKYYKVCSADNGKCVVVRHNNFGPIKRLFRQGRIIDLSRKAFSELADLKTGVINVTVAEAEGQMEQEEYGRYIGTVKAEWLGDGRTMRLLETFTYIDPKGLAWIAPAGSEVDGASIPRVAWSVIGGPFEGKYRNASVIHDVACVQKIRPWESVHETFYFAMLASKVDPVKAKIMYAAVYNFGPRWNIGLKSKGISVLSVVAPPERKLEESDFANLKAAIEERESSAKGPMSLEEIRNYQPAW